MLRILLAAIFAILLINAIGNLWFKEKTEWIIDEGAQGPEFTVEEINGSEISLSDFRGKYVLLDFWISDRHLERIQKIYHLHQDSLVVIGFTLNEDREAVREYVENEGIKWLQVMDIADNGGKVNKLYGVPYYPTYFLIDPEGYVAARDLWVLEDIEEHGLKREYSSWF